MEDLWALTLWTIILCILFGYYLNNDIPQGLQNRYKFNLILAMRKLMAQLVTISSVLLGMDIRITEQRLVNWFLKYNRPALPKGVKARNSQIDHIPVRIYEPDGSKCANKPGLIYIHGGGMKLGSPYGNETFCAMIVQELGALVVSIDYRLAPQHPYPTAFTDCLKASTYFLNHASNFNVDPNNIGIAGDSVGGTLSASICLWLRDHNSAHRPVYQICLYPGFQISNLYCPSHSYNDRYESLSITRKATAQASLTYHNINLKYAEDFIANRHIAGNIRSELAKKKLDLSLIPKEMVSQDYKPQEVVGENAELIRLISHQITPYSYPLMADDLSRLPPAFILTVDFDNLRDDGVLYAKRMLVDGSMAVYHHVKGGWHGMFNFMDGLFKMDAAHSAMKHILQFMKEHSQQHTC